MSNVRKSEKNKSSTILKAKETFQNVIDEKGLQQNEKITISLKLSKEQRPTQSIKL